MRRQISGSMPIKSTIGIHRIVRLSDTYVMTPLNSQALRLNISIFITRRAADICRTREGGRPWRFLDWPVPIGSGALQHRPAKILASPSAVKGSATLGPEEPVPLRLAEARAAACYPSISLRWRRPLLALGGRSAEVATLANLRLRPP